MYGHIDTIDTARTANIRRCDFVRPNQGGPYFDDLTVGQVFDCGAVDDADVRCRRRASVDRR